MAETQKTCFVCGLCKPLFEFYVHPRMADGHLGKCKECCKAATKKNMRMKSEYYREYDRQRNMLPHRVEERLNYSKTERGRITHNKATRCYLERNPDKYTAKVAAGNAVRAGRLTPKPCEICGSLPTQGHHQDYSKPLQVLWLCVFHHQQIHKIDLQTKDQDVALKELKRIASDV